MFENFINHTSKSKLNWLRAAVLGANDGIVSIAGLVVGVAGATTDHSIIATAGIAGLVAGALSMAAGEYISVSTQRDAEKSYISKEKAELAAHPKEELQELISAYKEKGLTTDTATKVANELTANDALRAHLEMEFGLDEDDLTNPWHAAWASAISFTLGGLIPLVAILSSPQAVSIWVTFISVIVALALTGYLSALIGGAPTRRATIRVILGGTAAMLVTYGIGVIFGVAIA
jgi:VIT1/CCC1 family predicted Fe2+/Mn2+ transporter